MRLRVVARGRELPEVERGGTVVVIRGLVRCVLRCGGGGDRDAAVERTHDSAGHRVGKAERCTDYYGVVADIELARVGELQRLESAFDLDDGQIGDRIGSDEFGRVEVPVIRLHRNGRVCGYTIERDHVGVGEDVAVFGEDYAGPSACCRISLNRDGDDGGASGGCDCGDLGGIRCIVNRDGGGADRCGCRRPRTEVGRDRPGCDSSTGCTANECGDRNRGDKPSSAGLLLNWCWCGGESG